jgi:hypothetical protein
MTDGNNIDDVVAVIYRVLNPIISNADAPQIYFSSQFAATFGPWVIAQCFYFGKYSSYVVCREIF